MTSHPDIDVIVFDILGTMVDEPSGIRRGVRALLPNIDDETTSELVAVWHRHVDEQQREVLAGRRPYANSTVIDLEAATRVAAAIGHQRRGRGSLAGGLRAAAGAVAGLCPGAGPDRLALPGRRLVERQPLGAHPHQRARRASLAPGALGRGCAQLQTPSRRLPTRDHQRRLLAGPPAHGRCPCLGPSRCPGCRHEDCLRRTSRRGPSECDGLLRPACQESR